MGLKYQYIAPLSFTNAIYFTINHFQARATCGVDLDFKK